MARRGKPSTAHEYDTQGQCKYCDMHRVNVITLSHVCTPLREQLQDALDIIEDAKLASPTIPGVADGK